MRYLNIVLNFFVLISLLLCFANCGAMFNGSTKNINIQTNPSGTKITTIPSTGEFVAPTNIELERKHSYTLTFTKAGYKPASVQIMKKAQFGMIFLDVFFTGIIGVVVDAVTGSWNNLSPDQVYVSLEKLNNSSVDGPDLIEISLNSKVDYKNEMYLKIDATEQVFVSVKVE